MKRAEGKHSVISVDMFSGSEGGARAPQLEDNEGGHLEGEIRRLSGAKAREMPTSSGSPRAQRLGHAKWGAEVGNAMQSLASRERMGTEKSNYEPASTTALGCKIALMN